MREMPYSVCGPDLGEMLRYMIKGICLFLREERSNQVSAEQVQSYLGT